MAIGKKALDIFSRTARPESKQSKPGKQGLLSKQSKQSLHSKQSKQGAGLNTADAGLPDGWTRKTFIIRKTLHEQVKKAAYIERREIKEIIEDALTAYLSAGKIKKGVKSTDEKQ